MKTIIFTSAAAKDLDGLPVQAREEVTDGLTIYGISGRGDVKALKERHGYRLRIGNYRVIFDQDETTILAIYIGRRNEATYRRGGTMKPQIITTPRGDEMVVISKAEYDALVAAANIRAEADEDADDVAIYDARKAELQASSIGVLPAEVSMALVKGETRIKAIRKWRGMSQDELAAKAEISQGYLSDVENGKRVLAAATAAKTARALDVPLVWLA